jgi:hypothetical protein
MASPCVRKLSLLRIALSLLCATALHNASAQTVPGLYARPDISTFAAMTANVTPNFGYFGTPAVLGYTVGGYIQTRSLVGFELRGSIQRRLNAEHQESILTGPRFALHYGPFYPYISTLVGAGNGWHFKGPPIVGVKAPKPVEGAGPQWTLLGGVDMHFNHHFAFRLGEVSYSQIYLKRWTLTPLNLTAGVVYRIN